MPEDGERLRRTLTELHEELESSGAIDPGLRDPLREVLHEIQDALDRSDTEARTHGASLSERLQEMALEFERDHPTLAGTLNRLTHALSSMGI
jgi:hypothetical protein